MKCIKCGGETKVVLHHGIELNQCRVCSGIWFDQGELQEVLETEEIEQLRSRVDTGTGHDAITVPCPKCGGNGTMVPVVQIGKGFRVDTCTCCYGHWLDGGELEKLRDRSLFEAIRDWLKRS